MAHQKYIAGALSQTTWCCLAYVFLGALSMHFYIDEHIGESQKEIKEKPIMKNHAKKHIAMLLSVCLILGTLVPIPVVGAGEQPSPLPLRRKRCLQAVRLNASQ